VTCALGRVRANVIHFHMAKNTSRRNFLRTAPLAAAAGFTLTDTLMAAAQTASGADVNAVAQPFKLFTAKDLDADMKALDAKPGDNRLYDSKANPVQVVLTTEKHKSAAEFEWHEGRDHVVQIIDGSTLYEVGGTPTGTKVMGPGEWHATGATGSKSIILGKGDMLVIPRGTLHKRSTEDSVTILLISNAAPAKA
jgi:mannose-6-phosphate isomerase-like protein (cupin superfamily)